MYVVFKEFHYTDRVHRTTQQHLAYLDTVFTRLNAAAFITFELVEGGGSAYSRAAFMISAQSYSINLTRFMVQAVGTVAWPGALEKESQQLPTMLCAKYCIYSMKRLLFRR